MGAHVLADRIFWLQILAAIACGVIIGIERQLRGKPIGIRTSILICLGTLTYIDIGMRHMGQGDPTRVLGQVATGVGFLGAGLMMHRQGLVTGITSAAVVWLLAAIGCAIGFREFGLALAMALVSVTVLVSVHHFERLFQTLRRGVHDDKSSSLHGQD
ncbi:MAG: MgtC/SapB family protein [Elusimicrobiota bacterium]